MSMNQTKLSGVTYDSNGQLQYNQLYPLLKDYWDKPLAEMPEDLRLRVKFAVPCWDDIDSSNMSHDGSSQRKVRQQLIKYYEWHQDPSQERDTYKALREFQDEKLKGMIDEAIRNGIASVAVALRDDVALSLEKIISEVGIHWPETEPILWRSLYRFREKTLPIIRDQAKADKDSHLVLALDEISLQIYIILRAQQYRMGDEIESAREIESAAQASHVYMKLEEASNEKHGLKKERNDALSLEINAILSAAPTLTPGQVMQKVRDRIGNPNCPIVGVTIGGLQWERDVGGTLEEITCKNIERRVLRWKKKHKTST